MTLPPMLEPVGPIPDNPPGKLRLSHLTIHSRNWSPLILSAHEFFRTKKVSPHLDGMFFQPALVPGQEQGIFWLRNPKHYPVYLRESPWCRCGQYWRIGHKEALSWHVVAIAVHAQNRDRFYPYRRRFFWMKYYDAFHGHSQYASDDPYNPGWYRERLPAEAVATWAIQPNVPGDGGKIDLTFNRASLCWKGEQ